MIDSQSVKTIKAGGPKGYDADKTIEGCKRHAMVDSDSRALESLVQPTVVQDRDGVVRLLRQSRRHHTFVGCAFADNAYNSARVADTTSITVEIVREFANKRVFAVHPRLSGIDRTSAWINLNRQLAKTSNAPFAPPTAFLYAAAALVL